MRHSSLPPHRRAALAALLGAGATAALAAPEGLEATDLYAADPLTGLALRGYDAVSYFLAGQSAGQGGPSAGREGIELVWSGVAWRFARAANREAFRAAPATYAPRLAGYDAEAAAAGRLVDADPLVPALVGGRLYLFRHPGSRDRVLAAPGLLAEAERRWPDLARQLSAPAQAALT